MIFSLIKGILLGFGAAVPPGAVNVLILNTALKSYRLAFFVGLGALSIDLLFLCLVLLGFENIFGYFWIKTPLSIFGSLFLLFIALQIFKNRNEEISQKKVKNKSAFKAYLSGLSMNFLNPYVLAFWISVASYASSSNNNIFIVILGTFLAVLAWIIFFPYLIHKTKSNFSVKTFKLIAFGTSFLMLCFGLILLFRTIILFAHHFNF